MSGLLRFLAGGAALMVAGVAGAAEGVVIPFEMRGGRVMVPVEVNGGEARSFMMDSGFEMTFLSAVQADELKLRKVGEVTIAGIAGDEPANVFEGARFKFGGREWAPREVAAFPHGERRQASRRPGVLGSEFFKEFVVEVNPKREELRLHAPGTYEPEAGGEVITMEFRRTTPVILARILIPGHDPIEGRFTIDTGCDGGLCLGERFVREHDLVSRVGETRPGGRVGVGGDVDTLVVRLPGFEMGNRSVKGAEANFFLKGSPGGRRLAGHIGSGILNEFRVAYDYSRKRMILWELE